MSSISEEFLEQRGLECAVERRSLENWLRWLRPARWIMVTSSIILASVAGATFISHVLPPKVVGIFALIASVLNLLHTGLRCDAYQDKCERLICTYALLSAELRFLRESHSEPGKAYLAWERRFRRALCESAALAPLRQRKEARKEVLDSEVEMKLEGA